MTKIIDKKDFSVKITRKRGIRLHMFLASLVKNHIFLHLTLKFDILTLKMAFIHRNSTVKSLFYQYETKKRSTSHEKDVLHFFLFFFLKFNVFFLHFDLWIDLKTLTTQNDTISGFSCQNPMKKSY